MPHSRNGLHFPPAPRPLVRIARCALFLFWAAAAPCAEPAPAGPRDTLELKPGRAERPAPLPTQAGKTVIVPTDVDRQLGNLGDMLQRAAGVHVMRSGGMGDYLGVSIRGASESQVSVYVDGVLRNQANDPSLFLGDWDLSRVERIEVYKGLAPDDMPGAPMGGAINIVTRNKADGPSAHAALGAGSFGSLRANGAVDYRRETWRGRFEAARNQADGDFPYYDDNGTEFQPGRHPDGAQRLGADDLTRKIRRNNAHAFSELSADLSFRPAPALEAGAQADVSRLRKEVPEPGPNLDPNEGVGAFRESDRVSLRGYGRWTGTDAEASFDLSGSRLADVYVDTSKGGGGVGLGYDDDRNAYTDLLASLWGRAKGTGGLTLSALLSYGISGYAYTDRLEDRAYPGIYRYTGEGKFTPVYVLGRHTVEAILSAAFILEEHYGHREFSYGGYPVPAEAWSEHASLRLGYQYRPRPWLWFSAQAGNAYRVPTFLERFGDRGAILANPALRTESGVNGSLGAHGEGRGYSGDLQAFATEGRRIITLMQNSQFVMVYRNTDATRVLGLESRLSAAPRSWTRTDLDLTLMKAVNVSGGPGASGYKLIPYRPVTQASLRQTLLYGRWTLAATGYYQGLAYPNASNQASLFDSYSHNTEWQTRADLDLSWRVKHLLIAVGAHNLFDQRLFDFFNYPLPGRNFSACLQADY
ncbi:MAG TPA: TonB-dependent receptor plug domain-containing protein [Fibrobacteria bacterium]|nr:TonB-dependent receptor plug domain-containing protein [Fibrobacteria bacterium]